VTNIKTAFSFISKIYTFVCIVFFVQLSVFISDLKANYSENMDDAVVLLCCMGSCRNTIVG